MNKRTGKEFWVTKKDREYFLSILDTTINVDYFWGIIAWVLWKQLKWEDAVNRFNEKLQKKWIILEDEFSNAPNIDLTFWEDVRKVRKNLLKI